MTRVGLTVICSVAPIASLIPWLYQVLFSRKQTEDSTLAEGSPLHRMTTSNLVYRVLTDAINYTQRSWNSMKLQNCGSTQ